MTKLRAAAAMVCLALLAACSSGGDDSGDSPPPTSSGPSSGPSSDNSVASATPTTSTVTSGSAAAGDTSALLTAAEVGTGYTLAASQTDGESALPCTPSAPPLFTQAPPSTKANHNYQSAGDTVEISEVLATYGDGAGASKAYTTGSAGFSCTSGMLSKSKVTIVKRTEGAPAGSGIDDLGAWDFEASGIKGTAVLMRVGSKLIGLTFVATPAAAAAVPVGDITEKAATKVIKAG